MGPNTTTTVHLFFLAVITVTTSDGSTINSPQWPYPLVQFNGQNGTWIIDSNTATDPLQHTQTAYYSDAQQPINGIGHWYTPAAIAAATVLVVVVVVLLLMVVCC